MAKEKVCKSCRAVFEGTKCPNCGSEDLAGSYKGKVVILNPKESEIAKNLKIEKKGTYAIKIG